jgi:biopolymer transport protein ExbD
VSTSPVHTRVTSIAALFAVLLFGLAACMVGCSHTPTGIAVRIAGIGRCTDVRDVILDVLPGGGLRVNSENQTRDELGRRLEGIFRTRFYRYVFVTGDPNVPFGEVAEVIDIASKQVDYVAILTPSVMKKATYLEDGTCLDPNLPGDYIAHPPR